MRSLANEQTVGEEEDEGDEEDEEGAVPVRRGDEPGNGANSDNSFSDPSAGIVLMSLMSFLKNILSHCPPKEKLPLPLSNSSTYTVS